MAKDKKPAEAVGKLIKKHAKKKPNPPTAAGQIRLRGGQPKPKGEPKAVLGLIARFTKKK